VESEIVHLQGVSTSKVSDRSLQMLIANLNFFEKHRPQSLPLLRVFLAPVYRCRALVARLSGDKVGANRWEKGLSILADHNLFEDATRYWAISKRNARPLTPPEASR